MAAIIKLEDEPLQQSSELVLQFHRPKPIGIPRYYPRNPDAWKLCEAMDRVYLTADKLDALRRIGCIRVEIL